MSDDAPEPEGFLAILRAISPGRLVAASLLVSTGVLSLPCAFIGLFPLSVGCLMLLDSCAYPGGAPVHARVSWASCLAIAIAGLLGAGSLAAWMILWSPLALLAPPLLGAALSPIALMPFVAVTAPAAESRLGALRRAADLAGAAGPRFVVECALIGAALVLPIPAAVGAFRITPALTCVPAVLWLLTPALAAAWLSARARRVEVRPLRASDGVGGIGVATLVAVALGLAGAFGAATVSTGSGLRPGPPPHVSGERIRFGHHPGASFGYPPGSGLQLRLGRPLVQPFGSALHVDGPGVPFERAVRAVTIGGPLSGARSCDAWAGAEGGAVVACERRTGDTVHLVLGADGRVVPAPPLDLLRARLAPPSRVAFAGALIAFLLAVAFVLRGAARVRALALPVVIQGRLTAGETGAVFESSDGAHRVTVPDLRAPPEPTPATLVAPRPLDAMGYRTAGEPLPAGARCVVGGQDAAITRHAEDARRVSYRWAALGLGLTATAVSLALLLG